MANVTAKLTVKGKHYEILVDVDNAIKVREGKPVSMQNTLALDKVFYDIKKGMSASGSDLKAAFGTEDVYAIAQKIIRSGEVLIPSDYKNQEREQKIKQVVEWLSKNALDATTNKPHSAERIKSALQQAGLNIDNRPITEQIPKILEKIREILPIKIETKKISVRVPATLTGQVYGLINEYKEKEEWLGNGDLMVTINLPVGMQMEFYDKLNHITHGAAIVQEIK